MNIYNVGNDIPYDINLLDDNNIVWLVYYYESGYYSGSGEYAALLKNGNIYAGTLDHCSCYPPFNS